MTRERRKKLDQNTKEALREVQKELVDEWVDRQYARIGRWTVNGIKIGVCAFLMKLFLHFVTLKVGDINLMDIAPKAEQVTPHVR